MALLEALGIPRHGPLARWSAQLGAYLLSRGSRGQICLQGSLQGSVVLVPIYAPYRAWRWSPVPSMPEGFGRQAARLSLLALLAVWRAGGRVAPVTAELLEPPRNRQGQLLIPELRWDQRAIPSVLQQWQPAFILSFGALDELFTRSVASEGFWTPHTVKYLRLDLQSESQPEHSPSRGSLVRHLAIPRFRNDHDLELSEVALSFAGGEEVTFQDILAAVADPAGNLASSPEGSAHIVRLLRAARRRAAPPATARPPWWRVGGHWPPQRRAAAPTMWTAVDALDPNRQGRTLDGEVYYWNRETNETTWDRPFGGRRSEPRRASRAPPRAPPGAAGAAGARRREHEVSRGQRRPRPRRLGLSLEFLGSSGYVKSTSLARSE
ncbi:unnamed protein product [Durusdinium trenchii]|uniref:WW domain-containing protein n=1 Tax=Durusdinium trenchii TaxID=1381693 RepID=A0ABP0NDL9_9DINO